MDNYTLQKQISLAQSTLNMVQDQHCGDQQLLIKLAQLHTNEITMHTLKLIKVSRMDLAEALKHAEEWVEHLKTLIQQTQCQQPPN